MKNKKRIDELDMFLKDLKTRNGHILRKIRTADNRTLIYYREYGTYPTDVKIRSFGCK